MHTLEGFILNVNNLNAKDLLIESVSSRTEELTDQNVSQMDKGLLSTGDKITPEYSDFYAEIKGFKTPNLELFGDFKAEMYSSIEGDKIKYGSADWKEAKLQGYYGDKIFGVTDDSLIEISDMDLPETIDKKMMK